MMKLSPCALIALCAGMFSLTGCESKSRTFGHEDSGTDETKSDAGGTGEATDEKSSDAGESDVDGGQTLESDAGSAKTDQDAGGSPVASCESDGDCDDGNLCNGDEICDQGECISGQRADDGAECTLAGHEDQLLLCINGNCTETSCGDGIVDDRTDEECDDGNAVDGDGCEVGCFYSCNANADCDDSNVCNGDETCDTDTHACVAGDQVDNGTSCGDNRECNEGRCIAVGCGNGTIEDAEECDDGNLDDGDGCDSDCTYTCTEDVDCDDGSVCTGEATCDTATHACVAGEALVCDDNDDCTENLCDPERGCFYQLIDVDGDGQASTDLGECGTDCDDNDKTVYSGATELCDQKDNNCNDVVDEEAPTWYVDCDGDSYALKDAPSVKQCEMPQTAPSGCPDGSAKTWTSTIPTGGLDDCYDEDADVKPRITDAENNLAWSSTGVSARPIGSRFDYNCDGDEEPRITVTNQSTTDSCGSCSIYIGSVTTTQFVAPQQIIPILSCCGNAGWTGSTVPACGTSASYSRCDTSQGTCQRLTNSYTQSCR